jgi:O-antigen/teichoic acid export membrane protein
LVNLVVPVVHANAALSTSLIPALARARTRPAFWRTFRFGSLVLGVGAVAWLTPVVVFSRPLVGWLYGGRYAADQVAVALVAVFALLTAVVGAMSAVLRSEARPERVFWPYALSAMVTCSVGLWLVLRRGLLGAAAGFALSWVVVAVVMGLLVIAMKPSTLPGSENASGIERSQQ